MQGAIGTFKPTHSTLYVVKIHDRVAFDAAPLSHGFASRMNTFAKYRTHKNMASDRLAVLAIVVLIVANSPSASANSDNPAPTGTTNSSEAPTRLPPPEPNGSTGEPTPASDPGREKSVMLESPPLPAENQSSEPQSAATPALSPANVPTMQAVQPITTTTTGNSATKSGLLDQRDAMMQVSSGAVAIGLASTSLLLSIAGLIVGIVALVGSKRSGAGPQPAMPNVDESLKKSLVQGLLESSTMRQVLMPVIRSELDRHKKAKSSTRQTTVAPKPNGATVNMRVTQTVAEEEATIDENLPVLMAGLRSALEASDTADGGEEGYCEFEWATLQKHFQTHLDLESARNVLQRIERRCRKSDIDVLQQGNVIKLRHLRSPSGTPNIRLGIRTSALSHLFHQFE